MNKNVEPKQTWNSRWNGQSEQQFLKKGLENKSTTKKTEYKIKKFSNFCSISNKFFDVSECKCVEVASLPLYSLSQTRAETLFLFFAKIYFWNNLIGTIKIRFNWSTFVVFINAAFNSTYNFIILITQFYFVLVQFCFSFLWDSVENLLTLIRGKIRDKVLIKNQY